MVLFNTNHWQKKSNENKPQSMTLPGSPLAPVPRQRASVEPPTSHSSWVLCASFTSLLWIWTIQYSLLQKQRSSRLEQMLEVYLWKVFADWFGIGNAEVCYFLLFAWPQHRRPALKPSSIREPLAWATRPPEAKTSDKRHKRQPEMQWPASCEWTTHQQCFEWRKKGKNHCISKRLTLLLGVEDSLWIIAIIY